MISSTRSKQTPAKLRANKTAGIAENFPRSDATLDSAHAPYSRIAAQLTGNIAHDLRSPITVIRGYVKMLLNGRIGPITGEQQECLEGALNGVNQLARIAGIVGEASGFAEHIQPEVLSFQDLWSKAWESVQPQALDKGLILKEQFTAERPMVCADRRMLGGVIAELLVRVVALAGRGTNLLVELSSLNSGNVVLRITFDCGSPEPDMERVVSGLLSKVFLHGGKLTISAPIESGSSITLSMPGCEA